jgi:hypothetical protein
LQKDTLLPLEGSRKKGRPKLRWLDSVLKYVRTLEVEARWKKALDRNVWGGGVIKEDKVHKEQQSQKKKKKKKKKKNTTYSDLYFLIKHNVSENGCFRHHMCLRMGYVPRYIGQR